MQKEPMQTRRILKPIGALLLASASLITLTGGLLPAPANASGFAAKAASSAQKKKAPAKKPPAKKPAAKPAAKKPPLTSVYSTPPQYKIFTRPVFQPMPVGTRPGPGEAFQLGPRIAIFMCADEVEPTTFGIYAVSALNDVKVSVSSPFVSESGQSRLPADAVSVHVVKPLRQAAPANEPVPELLVKDDREDFSGTAPNVRLTGDVATDIPAGSSKQIWVTVKVPRRQPVSTYKGTIIVSAAGVKATPVALVVDVLPMEIKTAFLQYGIDFRSRLASEGGAPGTVPVSEAMFQKQLADISDHGFSLVTLYDPMPSLENAVRLYTQAGLGPVGPVVIGAPISSSDDVSRIENLRSSLRLSPEFLFYYTLPAEAMNDSDSASDYASRVRKASRKALMVAPIASQSMYTTLGRALDVPVYTVTSDVAQNLVQTGKRTTSNRDWWSWNIAQETPAKNRLLAGYQLFKTGLNSSPLYGAFPGPYQYMPDGAGPFDPSAQMATYPAANGVIDTVQWEAAREGIDDIRYIGALKTVARQLLDDDKLKTRPAVKQAVADADAYLTKALQRNLEAMPPAEYQRMRKEVSDQTIKLLTILRTGGARIPR